MIDGGAERLEQGFMSYLLARPHTMPAELCSALPSLREVGRPLAGLLGEVWKGENRQDRRTTRIPCRWHANPRGSPP